MTQEARLVEQEDLPHQADYDYRNPFPAQFLYRAISGL